MTEQDRRIMIPMLVAILSGGGTAATLPKVAPDWYRPDPARGEELRDLRADVADLREEFQEFRRDDPARSVLATQLRIIERLDRIIESIDSRRFQLITPK